LYACIEDRVIDTRIRDPLSGLMKPVREWVPHFTLIAASNRPGDLTTSFRDRLRLQLRLEPYDKRDSAKIARQALAKMNLKCSSTSAAMIAIRGRGVPRRVIALCEQIRDIAVSKSKSAATPAICVEAFDALGVDPLGLARLDIEVLKHLAANIGQPVGLKSLGALVGEEAKALEEAVEPYLLSTGLIARTQRGRALTPAGMDHLRRHHGFKGNGRSLV